MSLSTLAPLLAEARAAGRAVAAFNVIQIEHAEAYAVAAERSSLPVVMQISENCVRYHGSLRPIAAATSAGSCACATSSWRSSAASSCCTALVMRA